MQYKNQTQLRPLIDPLHLVTSDKQLSLIRHLRRQEYQKHYPNITGYDNDPFDQTAVILFGADADNSISSTCRMVFDSDMGLPEDDVFSESANHYREHGRRLMEVGRFVIANHSNKLFQVYYRAFYNVARANNIDTIFMVMRDKNYPFHKKLMNAKKLPEEVGNGFGSGHTFVTVAWELDKTTDKFHSWAQTNHNLTI